jgi:hypothetical protein
MGKVKSQLKKDGSTSEAQLASFLAKFTPQIAAQAEAALAKLRKRLPHALELVYDNYNALAIGFGPSERASEAILSIAVYPKWISLFFLQGKGLPDPAGILQGEGNVARHVVLATDATLKEPAVQALIDEALVRAKVALTPGTEHRIIIKSISARQRPRRPPEAVRKPATKSRAAKR